MERPACCLCGEPVKEGEGLLHFPEEPPFVFGRFYNGKLILFHKGDCAHTEHPPIIKEEANMVLERKPVPEDKEWREMADFVIGKTIQRVENWDVGPTFIFTDGSSLELYTQKKGFAWVLEGEKQRSEAER